MKGIKLVPGEVVVLAQDGTLVYVEDVQPTFAAVVALPDQPAERNESLVFTPGKVGAKKISPYSGPERVVAIGDLSERNRDFVGTFEVLRKQHGAGYVDITPEERAKMTVRKAGPSARVTGLTPVERDARKQERRALKKRCATCKKRKKDHEGADHEFVASSRAPRGARDSAQPASPDSGTNAPTTGKRSTRGVTFKIVSSDLTKAQAHSDKFKDGNRFFRVFRALQNLPDSAGTFDAICEAIGKDGGRPMTDVEKVTRRALTQLQSDACGRVVVRS